MACFSFSNWQGPAIKVNGLEFEILNFPHLTVLYFPLIFPLFISAALIKDENKG